MSWRSRRQPVVVFLFLLALFPAGDLAAQLPRGGVESEPITTQVIIRVRSVRGTPLMGHALVRLTARVGSFDRTQTTREFGEVIFNDVTVGNYIAEVTAPGFLRAQEDIFVTMSGNGTTVVVSLTPEPEPGARTVPGGLPVLAPKAQQEIDKALEAMRNNNPGEARKRLEKAAKLAPGHPDIAYLFGMLYLQLNDPQQAKASFERAVALYPAHSRALAALGDTLMREGDYKGAIKALEKSLQHEPDTWQTQGMLASALYHEKVYDRARLHAQRALELSRGKSAEIDLLMAQILIGQGDLAAARPHLESFLAQAPNHPSAAAARQFLEPKAETLTAASAPAAAPAPTAPPKISVPRPEPPSKAWAPPDIDDVQPAVTKDVPCSMPDVLERASRRARLLVNNLERITATEVIEHAIVSGDGDIRESETRDFNYVVTIRPYRKNHLSVDEDRFGRTSFYAFSSGMAATGLAATALIFHPLYAPAYEMRCEGLGQWQGQPVWVVHFRQDPAKSNRFRTYRTNRGTFEVKLKGRAWLSTSTGDVLRIETDLVEPIEEAKLYRDHLVIEYAPVAFEKMKTQLWLPSKAELYSDLKGKRYRIRHNLRDFMLFSVDVSHEVEQVPDPPPDPPAPPL